MSGFGGVDIKFLSVLVRYGPTFHEDEIKVHRFLEYCTSDKILIHDVKRGPRFLDLQ
jgi:hypothetical protein